MTLEPEVQELLEKAVKEKKPTCEYCAQLPQFICRAPYEWTLLCEKHVRKYSIGYGPGLGYRIRNLFTFIELPWHEQHKFSQFK